MFSVNYFEFLEHQPQRNYSYQIPLFAGSERKAYFFGESQDKEMRMLNIKDYRKLNIFFTSLNCDVDVSSSRYIRCNGSEGRLFSSPFRLQRETRLQFYPYYVKVRTLCYISCAFFLVSLVEQSCFLVQIPLQPRIFQASFSKCTNDIWKTGNFTKNVQLISVDFSTHYF